MITTVTMNASLDKMYRVGRLTDRTVMRVAEVSNTAGGKGVNVAKVAALLGEKVAATGFLGGFNGAHVRALLTDTGVADEFVDCDAETRACINVMDDATGSSTEFLEPGVAVAPERYAAFLERYAELAGASDAVTISGSLPASAPEGFYPRLVEIAHGAGCPVVVDTSGRLLREAIAARPTLVKPNRDEIGDAVPDAADDAVTAVRRLRDVGIPFVAHSMGAEGCVFACAEGVFRGRVPHVRAVNPVGCGDSMTAAFAVGLARRMDAEAMLRLALAVSAASAMDGRTGCFDMDDFAILEDQVEIERIVAA